MTTARTLVGRDEESASLLQVLDDTVASRSARVVFLSGEAGIGKSSLLDWFVSQAVERYSGSDLLIGRGQALMNSSSTDSYQAIRESLRDLSRSAERRGANVLSKVARSFATHAPDWAESVPLVGGLISAGLRTAQTMISPDARPTDAGLSEQFAGLVEDLCALQPVVLILDDLHWADSDTINALSMIERRVHGPLLLVLAFRPYGWAEESGTQPLRKMIDRMNRYRIPEPLAMHLTALGDDSIRTIADQASESDLDPEELDRIVVHSGGNPLFAGELLRNASRRSALPNGISGVLRERLTALERDDLRILEKAAVVGFRFEIDHLLALSGLTELELYDRMDALLSEEMVVPLEPAAGREWYALRHPLIGELLTARIAQNPPRLRFLNSRLLAVLERAQPWDDATAIRAATTADRAGKAEEAARYAYDAAVRQFSLGAIGKALELAETAVRRAREAEAPERIGTSLVLLAECLTAAGAHAAAAERCLEAVDFVPLRQRGPVLFLRARNLRMQQNWEPARSALEELLSDPVEEQLLAKAKLLLAEILLTGPAQDLDQVVALCDEAERTSDDPTVLLRATGHRGLAQLAAGDAAAAEETLQLALTLARSSDDPYAEYEAVHWLAKKHLAALELSPATELLSRLEELSERHGVYSANPRHLRDRARVLALSGDVDEAAADIAEFVRNAFDGLPGRTLASVVCQVHELDQVRGRNAGDAFVDALHAEANGVDDGSLASLFELLRDRPSEWDPAELAARSDLISEQEAGSAVATFRFYMSGFDDFRADGIDSAA
jgi:tetratricopeptide (TPR) repeat protein